MNLQKPSAHFPSKHRVPARGWINDPNGIHKNGDTWHVFFQWNPHSARHNQIQWGHCTSTDLVHWEERPAALAPRPGEADSAGCWSGVGTMDTPQANGVPVPTLVYSAVSGGNNQLSAVTIARGDASGSEFGDHTVVVPIPEIEGLTGIRDPFLLEFAGHRFGIQGAGIRRENGRVDAVILGWLADDLEDWKFLGEVASSSEPGLRDLRESTLWECPQLVEISGRWVLIVGLWRGENEQNGESALQGSGYAIGDLSVDTGADGSVTSLRFHTVEAHGLVDEGPDFYAPQAYVDSDRVLLWGWSWEGAERTQEQTDSQGWAGCLTLPRTLSLEGNILVSSFADEVLAHANEVGITSVESGAEVVAIAEDGTERVIATLDGPGKIAVDASIVEVLPAHGTPMTVRVYDRVEVRTR